jgi:serine/threonine protein phosphatase 1
MTERIIAIGDIHGCARALEALLQTIQPTANDLVIPLGDVVDRGPDSKQVVEILLQLRNACQLRPVLGNHEEMLLSVLVRNQPPHTWIQCGGTSTLDSYGFDGDLRVIPDEHVEFLKSFENAVETETHFFVHGNYNPEVPVAEQLPRILRWTSLHEFLPGPHHSGRIAIVGHTPDKSGEVFFLRHLHCLDTYCHGGQWLTAMDVVSGQIWQANDAGQIR